MLMELGVCGFGYSGSGAILDMLKDYPDVSVSNRMEVSFLFKPDGLEDLGRAVCYSPSRYWSSDSAIRRFYQEMRRLRKGYNRLTHGKYDELLDSYMNSIVQISWRGYTGVHYYQENGVYFFVRQKILLRIRLLLEKLFGPGDYFHLAQKQMYYSYLSEEYFMENSRRFVKGLMRAIDANPGKRIMAVDQLFTANNPRKSFCYLEDPKAIVVTRDPRDTYILAKRAIGIWGTFIPTDNVDNFIEYYKGLMQSIAFDEDDKDILMISFEDFVYNHSKIRAEIESFLSLPHQDLSDKSLFNPQISINNTQLWKRFPNYEKDVERISKELNSYLFDFSACKQQPSFSSKVF